MDKVNGFDMNLEKHWSLFSYLRKCIHWHGHTILRSTLIPPLKLKGDRFVKNIEVVRRVKRDHLTQNINISKEIPKKI